MTILALILALQTDPIQELIDTLGDTDIEVRDAAMTRLLKMGEPARKQLEAGLKSKDHEISSRCRLVLDALDARIVREILKKHSGRIGTEDVWWFDREAFDVVGAKKHLPEEMAKALLQSELVSLVLIDLRDGTIIGSELAHMEFRDRTASEEKPRLWHDVDFVVNGSGAKSHSNNPWWGDVKSNQASELFRVWPRLRSSSIVLLAPCRTYRDIADVLGTALASDVPLIRACAAYAHRDVFTEDSVNRILPLLKDKEPAVREAVWTALRQIAVVMDCTPEKFREWWAGLSEKKRSGILKLQHESKPERSCSCLKK